jgi:hypothetical protein
MKPLLGNMKKHSPPPVAIRPLEHIITHDKDWVMESCSSSQEDNKEEDCHHWTSQGITNIFHMTIARVVDMRWFTLEVEHLQGCCNATIYDLWNGKFAVDDPVGSECDSVIGKTPTR